MITTIIIIILSAFLLFSVFLNVRSFLLMSSLEDRLNDSLDILDEQFEELEKILHIPVFSDEPVVRHVIQKFWRARDAIANVAIKLDEKDNNIKKT